MSYKRRLLVDISYHIISYQYVIIRKKRHSSKWLVLLNLVIKKEEKKKKDRVLTNPYSSNEFVTFACS